jgi:hypothetical protein
MPFRLINDIMLFKVSASDLNFFSISKRFAWTQYAHVIVSVHSQGEGFPFTVITFGAINLKSFISIIPFFIKALICFRVNYVMGLYRDSILWKKWRRFAFAKHAENLQKV